MDSKFLNPAVIEYHKSQVNQTIQQRVGELDASVRSVITFIGDQHTYVHQTLTQLADEIEKAKQEGRKADFETRQSLSNAIAYFRSEIQFYKVAAYIASGVSILMGAVVWLVK